MTHTAAKNDLGIFNIDNDLTRTVISNDTDLDICQQAHRCQAILEAAAGINRDNFSRCTGRNLVQRFYVCLFHNDELRTQPFPVLLKLFGNIRSVISRFGDKLNKRHQPSRNFRAQCMFGTTRGGLSG